MNAECDLLHCRLPLLVLPYKAVKIGQTTRVNGEILVGAEFEPLLPLFVDENVIQECGRGGFGVIFNLTENLMLELRGERRPASGLRHCVTIGG